MSLETEQDVYIITDNFIQSDFNLRPVWVLSKLQEQNIYHGRVAKCLQVKSLSLARWV